MVDFYKVNIYIFNLYIVNLFIVNLYIVNLCIVVLYIVDLCIATKMYRPNRPYGHSLPVPITYNITLPVSQPASYEFVCYIIFTLLTGYAK